MKKLLSVLLAVCLVFSMVSVAAVSVGAATVSADTEKTGASSKTVTVGVISYLINELGSTGWQVHYWGGSDGAKDANLTATGKTEKKSVGSAYWSNAAQTFTMFTTTIPGDATGYKVHKGDRWFGDDGKPDKATAYVFNYSGDKALYEESAEPETTAAPEPTTDEPTTDEPATDEPVVTETAYYIVGTMNEWAVSDAYKLTANEGAEGEYMFEGLALTTADQFKVVGVTGETQTWYPDGMGNNYGENGEITADGTYTVYFRPDGSGYEDWFYGVINVVADEVPTDEPTTDEPTTDEPTTDEPVVTETAYYIVGTMNEWAVSDAYKLTANEGAEGEYMFEGLALTTADQFKVVGVTGETQTWYPDGMGNNYGENGEITADGTYTVYFRPDGSGYEDWFYGVINVVADEVPTDEPVTDEPTTDEPTTEEPVGDVDFYLFGHINGANYACEDDAANMGTYKFADGKLTATFESDSYVAVKTTNNANWYMTKGWLGTDVTEATLYNTGVLGEDANKLFVPGGVEVTFTLTAGENDTYTLSYVTNGEPTTDEPTTDEPVVTETAYYIVGTMNEWAVSDAYKLTANEGAEGEYMFEGLALTTADQFKVVGVTGETQTWYPDGMGNNYGENGEITADGTYTVYFRPDGSGYEDWFYGVINVVADEVPTDEPTTDEPTTDEPTTDEPIVTETAYYIVGTMNEWAVSDAYKLTANEGAEGEYMFEGLALTTADQFKVVGVTGETQTWYPDGMGNNYGENGEITADGTYTVYFRPDGSGYEDWFYGVINVVADEVPTDEPVTDEPTTEEPVGDVDFYLFGYINGADYACGTDSENMGIYKFADGKLTATFESDSYVAVKTTDNANWYMTKGWLGTDVTEATLYNTGVLGEDANKLFVPGGVEVTFTLTAGENDTFTLSYTTGSEPTTDEPTTDQPTTDQPTTDAPTTDEPTTEEPSTPIGDEDTFIVAGSEAEIFGTGWDGTNEDNLMTKGEDGNYTKSYTVEKAYDSVQLKVVKNGAEWLGDETGNNVTFNLTGAGTFTVTINPETNEITVSGDIVETVTDIVIEDIYAVGNGEGYWLNGASWDPAYAGNIMDQIADNVWAIEFHNVPDGFERQIKFAINGAWTYNFGAPDFEEDDDMNNHIGEWMEAKFNSSNITFDTDDICTIKVQLDLTEFDFKTKTGAKFMLDIIYDEDLTLGDVDLDGDVDINDVTLLQRYIAEFEDADLSDEALANADVNGDGKVNVKDVTEIQRFIAEVITEF